MSTNTQALTNLKSVLGEGSRFDLLNLYKGVPLSCSAQVLKVGTGNALFKVHPPESTSLTWERYTWLQGQGLDQPLRAKVASFDIVTGTADLVDFKYTTSRLSERTQVRVEPKNPIPVAIESDMQRVVGSLADISKVGIGIYLYALEPEHAFRRAQVVQLSMQLPLKDGVVSVSMSGKIRGLVSVVDYHRMAVNFVGEPQEMEKVSQYVDQRREEILREIPKLYETLLKSKVGEQLIS